MWKCDDFSGTRERGIRELDGGGLLTERGGSGPHGAER